MGTWGYGPLENDDGADLAGDFEDSKDLTILERAINTVVNFSEDEYLQAPEASMAVAAAKIVLETNGMSEDLIEKAKNAVRRVLQKSELKDLWEESSENYDKWQIATKEILGE